MAKQTVTLNPGESKVVSFDVTPTIAKAYQVSVNGLSGSFKATPVEPVIAAELVGAHVRWGDISWKVLEEKNQWPANTDILLRWTIKNTGNTRAIFRVYMSAFTDWIYLEPGEETEVYEEKHTPMPQTTSHRITLSGGLTIAEARLIWDTYIEVTYI